MILHPFLSLVCSRFGSEDWEVLYWRNATAAKGPPSSSSFWNKFGAWTHQDSSFERVTLLICLWDNVTNKLGSEYLVINPEISHQLSLTFWYLGLNTAPGFFYLFLSLSGFYLSPSPPLVFNEDTFCQNKKTNENPRRLHVRKTDQSERSVG